MGNKVLVIDYGSQYNELIVRRIKDLKVEAKLIDFRVDIFKEFEKDLKNNEIKAIILSGGPMSVNDENAPSLDLRILDLNLPILGICYGMQLIAKTLKGDVGSSSFSEYGNTNVNIDTSSPLFEGLETPTLTFMSHNDTVIKLPEGFKVIARSREENIAGIENISKNIYCLQFHPEVRNTVNGIKIISNFLFNIAKIEPTFTMDTFIEDKVDEIKKIVGNKKVLLGISGGVDSTVAALLIHKAIGDNLIPLFINHGLLRKNEENEVLEMFKTKFNIKVEYFDNSEYFLNSLKGVIDPEEKRKVIGKCFIDSFKEYLSNYKEKIDFLAQGTLYTDKVESGSGGNSKVIKSHHNVGGLPKELGFKLLEPLDELYKDETRELGKKLGLDDVFVTRQPFPGPGLGIRVIGEITKEKLEIVKESDAILREEIEKNHLNNEIWQYFTALTNFKTVGVKGDERSYDYALMIRCVTSIDGMTADFYHLDYNLLSKISSRIVNEVKGVNKVLYDVTSKPPSTIEYE